MAREANSIRDRVTSGLEEGENIRSDLAVRDPNKTLFYRRKLR